MAASQQHSAYFPTRQNLQQNLEYSWHPCDHAHFRSSTTPAKQTLLLAINAGELRCLEAEGDESGQDVSPKHREESADCFSHECFSICYFKSAIRLKSIRANQHGLHRKAPLLPSAKRSKPTPATGFVCTNRRALDVDSASREKSPPDGSHVSDCAASTSLAAAASLF